MVGTRHTTNEVIPMIRMEWTPDAVHILLKTPARLAETDPWRGWLQARGGIATVRALLRTLPLTTAQHRLMQVLLDHPGASVARYQAELGLERSAFHAHKKRLITDLVTLLNDLPPVPAAAPPAPAPPIRSTLPAPLTALIGRAHEVAATISLLHRPDVRLVTLTGLGGSGKTRLSIQVASDLQAVFADGVMFVPLAAITDPDLVIPSIARHLDIPHDQHDDPLAAIQARLHDRHLLLVLDNLEHVVAAAPMVVQILTAAPRVKILTTSRILLHVSGEHIVRIPPLSSPALEVLPDPAAILTYDAVRLFIARGQAVYPELALTAATLAATPESARILMGCRCRSNWRRSAAASSRRRKFWLPWRIAASS